MFLYKFTFCIFCSYLDYCEFVTLTAIERWWSASWLSARCCAAIDCSYSDIVSRIGSRYPRDQAIALPLKLLSLFFQKKFGRLSLFIYLFIYFHLKYKNDILQDRLELPMDVGGSSLAQVGRSLHQLTRRRHRHHHHHHHHHHHRANELIVNRKNLR